MTAIWNIITREDYPRIRPLLKAAIAEEAYLTLPADASDEDCMNYWFGNGEVFTYVEHGEVLGTFYLRANHFKLGGHTANAGYVVAKSASGKGIGRKLGEKSIEEAKKRDFKAMQFNFVVSTNDNALHLWKALGFNIIGIIPEGYHLKQQRYVDAYIMHKRLR